MRVILFLGLTLWIVFQVLKQNYRKIVVIGGLTVCLIWSANHSVSDSQSVGSVEIAPTIAPSPCLEVVRGQVSNDFHTFKCAVASVGENNE